MPYRRLIRNVRKLTRILVPTLSSKPGASPGVVTPEAEAQPITIDVFAFGPKGCTEEKDVTVERCKALQKEWPCIWLDVSGLGNAALLESIGEAFDIHGLTLEDIANTTQRAKVEEFDTYLYIVCRSAEMSEVGLYIEQMSLVLMPNVLISFQEQPGDCFGVVRDRLRNGRGRMRSSPTDYLAYALLDSVVDSYFPVVEKLGDELDTLEDRLLIKPTQTDMSSVHSIKRDLLILRRSIWPHREALATLVRDESPIISKDTRTFLRDAQDHVMQIADIVETYREVCSDVRDLYLSSVNNRMSEVMKVLTVISTIFIPLTFIVGIYGMNFDNMPELHTRNGYFVTLLVMAGLGVAMFLWFIRQGWIGKQK